MMTGLDPRLAAPRFPAKATLRTSAMHLARTGKLSPPRTASTQFAPVSGLSVARLHPSIRASGNYQVRWRSMSESGLQQVCVAMREELKRFLLSRRVAEDEAEDLLQDLYVRITTSQMGPVNQPRAYLYRMVNNLAHDRRRLRTRSLRRDETWVKSSLGPDIERDPEPSAERVLIAREELRQVQGALDKLPTRTKEIFVNYRIEGVPQKTIAEMLGVSLSSVEKHLQRAYQTVLAIREQQHEPGAVMMPEGAVHVRRS